MTRNNADGQLFDNFAYHYHNVSEGYLRNTNRLRWVNDGVLDENLYEGDIEDQSKDNYAYDELGNLITDEAEDIKRIEWTVAGKVHAVIRKDNSPSPDMYFSYDAMGNRISKKAVDNTLRTVHTKYYFREASGNTMATYEKRTDGEFKVTEHSIYGSSRFGLYTPSGDQNITELSARVSQSNSYLGNRKCEFSDHLGNVHVVLSDRKRTTTFTDNVLSAYEYYPFGMAMQTYENNDYRYGFNGKEKDDE